MRADTTVDRSDLGGASVEQVLGILRTDTQAGLSDRDVDARLHRYGPNEVPERHPRPLHEFLEKFWDDSTGQRTPAAHRGLSVRSS
jgi:magnesium-transporting ATPase (P-type)